MVRENWYKTVQTSKNRTTCKNLLPEKMATMQEATRKMVHFNGQEVETYCEAPRSLVSELSPKADAASAQS